MQFIRKFSIYFIPPIFVLAVVLSVFYSYNLFPLGENSLCWGDMSQQNLPILIEFKDKISGGNGAFFSMQNAGGMDFSGIFLFLASSPFSLLAIFVKKADMAYFINIMIVLKLMTSSVTASFFFKKFFKNLTTLQTAVLSASYALCGYSMMFYQLHTWLDVMYMFPIFLVGAKKLLEQDKPLTYIITLSLMILFQFYLGYMLALFIIFGLFTYIFFFAEEPLRKKNLVITATSTLISLLLTAPIWLTALRQFTTSARGVGVITSLSTGEIFTDLNTTLPFIFATTFLIVTIPFIFLLKFHTNKTTRSLVLMLILMTIPIIIEPINKMWHTGSYQAFPVRYGFITVLVGLSLTATVISQLNSLSNKDKKTSLITKSVLIFIIAEFLVFIKLFLSHEGDKLKQYATTLWGNDASLNMILIFSAVSFASFSIVFFQYFSNRISKRFFSVLICLLVIMEGIFNGSVYIGYGARSVDNYKNVIALADKIPDKTEYRVKVKDKYFDVNLVGAMGYNTLSHYTSLIDEDYIFAMKKLGFSSYWMEVNSNGSTAFLDALLGNKYTISRGEPTPETDRIVYKKDGYSIAENEFNLPLGNIISKAQAKSLENLDEKDRIILQQKIYETLTESKNPLVINYKAPVSNGSIFQKDGITHYTPPKETAGRLNFFITVKGRQNLYFDCFRDLSTNLTEPINNSFDIRINGIKMVGNYPSKVNNGMVDLGIFEDESLTVSINILKESIANSFGVFGIDLSEMAKGLEKIRPASVEIDGDTIKATAITDDENQVLMLTIPHSEGFEIKVNGETVKAEKILDAFMAIPLVKGENLITLTYLPSGLTTGIALFLLGLSLLIAFIIFLKKKSYIKIKWLENSAYYAFIVFTGIIFLSIYIFPLIIFNASRR